MTATVERQSTLLLVDDEPAILQLLVEAFKDLNCSLLLASNGEQLLELFHRHRDRIDLVLLDWQLHTHCGMALAYQLQRMNPGVRIALMSGSPCDEPVEKLISAGVIAVFNKPFLSLAKLKDVLRGLISERM